MEQILKEEQLYLPISDVGHARLQYVAQILANGLWWMPTRKEHSAPNVDEEQTNDVMVEDSYKIIEVTASTTVVDPIATT